MLEMGRRDEGEYSLRQSLRLAPTYAPAHNNLAIALWRDGRFADAEAAYREALRLRPDFAEAFNNLGNVLRDLGRFDEALDSFDQALRVKPDYPDAHWNRALAWLQMVRCAEGWADYECRWKRKEFFRPPFHPPLWDGAPRHGRTILVHAEQGLGDTLQFIRYVPLVKQRGGRGHRGLPPPLAGFCARCPGIDPPGGPGRSRCRTSMSTCRC